MSENHLTRTQDSSIAAQRLSTTAAAAFLSHLHRYTNVFGTPRLIGSLRLNKYAGKSSTLCQELRRTDSKRGGVVPVTFSYKANLASISKKEEERSGERKYAVVLMFGRKPLPYNADSKKGSCVCIWPILWWIVRMLSSVDARMTFYSCLWC